MENLCKNFFMKKAIKRAIQAFNLDEVPVGAVIVRNGRIIASAYNRREKSQNAIDHAEIIAIAKACRKLKSWRLDDCEMFVTLEPCVMCAGAILNSRIKKLFFGAYEPKGGAIVSKYQLMSQGGLNWNTEFEGGLMIEECSQLVKDFFKNKRE